MPKLDSGLRTLREETDLRIVDCHAHLWSEADARVLVDEANRLRIERVCVSCLSHWDWSEEGNAGRGNSLVRSAVQDNPKLLGYVYVDPTVGDMALKQIDEYTGMPPFIGIKLWISCRANDRRVHPVLERASSSGLVVLAHAWRRGSRLSKGYQTLPSEVADLASSFPEVPIIMAHIGGDWENGALEVADAENVAVDTCGSINESGMIESAVDAVGSARVLFGSDAPSSGYLPNIGKIISAEIPLKEKVDILGSNFARLAGIAKHR